MAQLTAFGQVSDSLGIEWSGDGISSTGGALAYWDYLWVDLGNHAAADAFGALALVSAADDEQAIGGKSAFNDLPTSANPTKPILANQPRHLLTMLTARAMLPLYVATGVNTLNVHCYWPYVDCAQKQAQLQWMSDTVGLPLISNEMGQREIKHRHPDQHGCHVPGAGNGLGVLELHLRRPGDPAGRPDRKSERSGAGVARRRQPDVVAGQAYRRRPLHLHRRQRLIGRLTRSPPCP